MTPDEAVVESTRRQDPGLGPEVAAVSEWAVARLGSRFVAYALDVVLVVSVSSLVTLGLERVSVIGVAPRSVLEDVAVAFVSMAIEMVYLVGLWISSGQATVGMRVVGLRVGRASDGRPLDLRQALIRWLILAGALGILAAAPIDAVIFGLVGVIWFAILFATAREHPRGQGLHDRAAGSLVVQRLGASNAMGCIALALAVVALVVLLTTTTPPLPTTP